MCTPFPFFLSKVLLPADVRTFRCPYLFPRQTAMFCNTSLSFSLSWAALQVVLSRHFFLSLRVPAESQLINKLTLATRGHVVQRYCLLFTDSGEMSHEEKEGFECTVIATELQSIYLSVFYSTSGRVRLEPSFLRRCRSVQPKKPELKTGLFHLTARTMVWE